MINKLSKLIAIDSTRSEPETDAPFGSGGRQALDWFLAEADSMGMRCGELDGYCGWAEIGSGPLVGVLAHLDIVPCGEGWATNPLQLTIERGNMYGRGVTDDKGSIVATLHAMAELASDDLDFRVRLIVGCGEETGCECMREYAKHCEIPLYSFTPDAEFPVINSEKAIAQVRIDFPYSDKLASMVDSICCGERANIVPNSARCVLTDNGLAVAGSGDYADMLRRESVAETLALHGYVSSDFYFTDNGKLNIHATGRAAHGSTPQLGDNAGTKLCTLLSTLFNDNGLSFISGFLAWQDVTAKLDIAINDEQSGELTLNTGIINCIDGRLSVTIDMRMPISANYDDVLSSIANKLPEGCCMHTLEYQGNMYMSESSALVSTLMGVYNKHFSGNASPLQIGGGTYAKSLPNCVAFGPCPDGADFHIHDADEYMPVELFYKLPDIYRDAITALGKLAKNKCD